MTPISGSPIALVAETVVMMLQVVDLILVIALLTIPLYLAERHTRSLAGIRSIKPRSATRSHGQPFIKWPP